MSPSTAGLRHPDNQPAACFSIHAEAEPGVMPRVVELFAKRGLVPTSWISRVSGSELTIDLQMRGLGAAEIAYFAQCLRQIVAVNVVLASQRQ